MATKSEMKKIEAVAKLLSDDLATLVEAEKAEILRGLLDLAKGIKVIEEQANPFGPPIKKEKYLRYPDKDVAKYLIDQFIGKPKQQMEVVGNPDQPLVIQLAPEVARKYNLTPEEPNVTSSPSDNSGGSAQV